MPSMYRPRRRPQLALLLGGVLLGLLLTATPAAAHANLDRAEPAAGTAVPVAPGEIRLAFTEPLELRYSGIEVYDTARQRYDQGPVRLAPGDGMSLVVGVRDLPEGVYTVAWKANSTDDGHTTTGSYAFSVGNVPPPSADGDAGGTAFVTPTPPEIAIKWLVFLATMLFTGALGLRLLLWEPLLRPLRGADGGPVDELAARVSRRLALLAGAALPVLLLATGVGLVLQVAKVTGRSPGAALDPAALGDFLLQTRTGGIWSVRLLLPIVAGMLLGPLLVSAWRGPAAPGTAGEGAAPPAAPLLPFAFGAALGAAYLLTISLISHAAASPVWPPFTIAMDWAHQLATAVWVGGLGGLVLTLPLLRAAPHRTPPLLAVISRFSNIALASVAVLTVSGLYSAWLHVGSLDALLPTAYGRALVVKLGLAAGLVALGAFNLLWVRPRVAAHERLAGAAGGQDTAQDGRAAGAEGARASGRVGAVLLRLFGRVVRIEALLGVAILLAVAVLTGFVPAREAIVQARAPKRAQTLAADDLRLTLTLSSLQPGDLTFDVSLEDRRGRPVSDAQKVLLRPTHTTMDMGEAEAVAEPVGGGRYVARGPYLSMSGDWQVRAIVRRDGREDVATTFQFPIGSTANLALQPNPPRPPQLNSPQGLGFVSLGAGLICTYFGVRLFRRGSGFGTALLMVVPTALVVGGYLVYTGSPNDPALGRPVEPPNPVVTDTASIANGGRLFAENCVVCHGPQGRGDGPRAGTLNPRPPNMTLPHTAYHTDGYMFNAITNGFPGSAMPAWRDTFSEREKWDLVNYLRQFNTLTAGGATPPTPPRLPTPSPPNLPTVTPPASAAPGTPTGPPATAATPVGTPAPGTASSPAPPAATRGEELIHAFDGGIWATSPQGGTPTNLTPDLARDAYAGDPGLSPDGTTIVYTVVIVPAPPAQPTPGARQPLPGSDLWLMDRDGRGKRQIFKHDRPGALIELPTWTPDGKALVYTYTAPLIASDGRYTGSVKELQRLDPATGARTTLVKDGEDAGFAPAGGDAALAYVLLDPNTFEPSLWVARADGGAARRLVGPESRFLSLSAPRFSPDGRTIVFAASGGPAAAEPDPPRASGGNPLARLGRWLVEPLFPQGAAAHGPPADLYTIPAAGGTPRRLTNLNGDDPLAAWSPDGRRIGLLTGAGLYIVEADGSGLIKLSDRGSYSALIWAPASPRGGPAGAPPAAPGGGPIAAPAAGPTATPTDSSTDEGRSQRRALGDLVVGLSIGPRIFAPTDIAIRLEDRAGRPVEGVRRVDLQVAMVGMNHGLRGIAAEPDGPGRYRARAALLTMEGPWLLAVRVERDDGQLVSGVFPFAVPPDTPSGAVSAYYLRPAGATRIVDVAVYPGELTPARVEVAAGQPVRLSFMFVDRPPCGPAVRLGEQGLRAEVTPEGLAELVFVPDRSGPLTLACTPDGVTVSRAPSR